MNKLKLVNQLVMVIGSLSVLSVVFLALKGHPFQSYYFSILIGVVLFGTAYFNNRQMDKNGDEKADL